MHKKLKNKLEEYLVDSDRLVDEYYDEFGEFIICTESFTKLTTVLKEGLEIYNLIITEELYKDDEDVQKLMSAIFEKSSKLEINEENAKKLNTRNAIESWMDLQSYLLTLAVMILGSEENEQ